jgi:hypothetical protein
MTQQLYEDEEREEARGVHRRDRHHGEGIYVVATSQNPRQYRSLLLLRGKIGAMSH